jgi:1-acyl-sn-glycerol-3-phosphate acyltransferase
LSVQASVQAYIAKQAQFTWRRYLLRRLIQTLGFKVLWRVEISGTEHIPPDGATLLMMNHISGIDPVLCMGAVSHRYVIPMTKIENARHPVWGFFVWWYGAFTVNRGEVDRSALLNSIELIKSGQLVLIAPEGTRTPEGLTQPKDGLAYVATKADAVIVPVAVSGAIGWEKKLFRLQRPHIRIDFGRAFRFKTEGRTRIPREELSQMMGEAMYQLAAALPDEGLRGAYRDLSQATTHTLEFVSGK